MHGICERRGLASYARLGACGREKRASSNGKPSSSSIQANVSGRFFSRGVANGTVEALSRRRKVRPLRVVVAVRLVEMLEGVSMNEFGNKRTACLCGPNISV